MNLEYVPLLRVMRDIQSIPRGQPPEFNGMKRFRQYLRTIFDYRPPGRSANCRLLLAMNPMGKDHVTALLDAYLAMDADGIGARAPAEASAAVGRTRRGTSKWALWCATILWAGEATATIASSSSASAPISSVAGAPPRSRTVGLRTSGPRACYGAARPLTEQAVRELIPHGRPPAGVCASAPASPATSARCSPKKGRSWGVGRAVAGQLSRRRISPTREVLSPYLDADDMRTCIECLFGDAAARTLGFTPTGLSPWAGLALALHDARADATVARR